MYIGTAPIELNGLTNFLKEMHFWEENVFENLDR